MAIEVNNVSSHSVQQSVEKTQNSAQNAKNNESTQAANPVDKVSLTQSAAQLQELEATIASLPVVDAGRVESVQRAIATGNHHIDPPTIAENLLTQEAALAQKE